MTEILDGSCSEATVVCFLKKKAGQLPSPAEAFLKLALQPYIYLIFDIILNYMSSLAFGVERYLISLFLITNIRVKTLGFIFIAWLF